MQQPHHTSPAVSIVSEGRIFRGLRTPLAYVWLDTGLLAPSGKRPAEAPAPRERLTRLLRTANISDRERVQHLQCLRKLSSKELAHLSAQVQDFSPRKR